MNEQVRVTRQVPLAGALELVHAVHSQRWLTIRNIHLCNTSNVAVSAQVALARPGVIAQQSTALVWDLELAGNDFLELGENLEIPPTWEVWAGAGAANAIVITLSGREE